MAIAATLIGRDRELATVTSALRADADRPLLVVAGEAGIGKSHLVAAAVTQARGRGQVVLRGWCLDLWEELPFLAIVDVVRDLAGHDDRRLLKAALAACPSYVEQQIIALVPELESDTQPAARGSGRIESWQRERVFAAIMLLLRAAAELAPVAVVIEDLHWADPSTQDLIRYANSPSHTHNVPIVVTTRIEGGAASWLRDLASTATAIWLELNPLGRRESDELVASLRPHSRAEAGLIFERSGGNPLFIEHLAAARVVDDLPPSLETLLIERLAELDQAELDVVRALAVVGRSLDDAAAGALVDRSADDLARALRSLRARRLVERTGAHQYGLHHALVAEVVRSQTTDAQARDIHRRAARVLAARGDQATAGAIADHLAAVDDRLGEARWRLAAARYADALAAPFEAARQWRRLVELSRDDATADLDLTLVELYLSTFSALKRANEALLAADLADEALNRLPARSTAAEEVRVYYEIARFRHLRDPQQAIELLEHAIEIGEQLRPTPEYLRAVEQLVTVQNRVEAGNYQRQAMLIERALRAATEAGLHAEQKLLTASLAWRAMALAERRRAFELVDRALAVVVDPPDPPIEAVTAIYSTDVLLKYGVLDRVVAIGTTAIALAQSFGQQDTFEALLIRSNTLEALRELGRTADMASLVVPTTTALTRSTALAHSDIAALRLAEGDLAAAARFWDDNAALLGDWGLQFDREFRLLRDEFLLWAGRADEVGPDALAVLQPLALTAESALAGGLLVLAMRACADRAVAARMVDDAAGAAAATSDAQELIALAESCVSDPFADRDVPITATADAASWRAERSRVAGAQDAGAWAEAATRWTDLDRPHRAAYALWRQAEALLADPNARAAAKPVLVAATEAARGHAPLVEAVATLAQRAHIVVSAPQASPARLAPAPFGLTGRELMVVRLLGQGQTNGEIAAALFISTKTASVHVSSILRKMQVTSRVQAAAIAAQTGLLHDSPQAPKAVPRARLPD